MTTLECGHTAIPQEPGSLGTGYASFPDGSKACYDCADAITKMHGAAGTLTLAYLRYDGSTYCTVRTWSGGYLGAGRVLKRTKRCTPTGGRFTEVTGRVGILGREYAFRAPDENGTYVRLRALKGRG